MASRGSKKKEEAPSVLTSNTQSNSSLGSFSKLVLISWIIIALLLLCNTLPMISLKYTVDPEDLGGGIDESEEINSVDNTLNFSGWTILFAPTLKYNSVIEIIASRVFPLKDDALSDAALDIAKNLIKPDQEKQLEVASIILFIFQLSIIIMLVIMSIILIVLRNGKKLALPMIICFSTLILFNIGQFVIELIMFSSATAKVSVGVGAGVWIITIINIVGLVFSILQFLEDKKEKMKLQEELSKQEKLKTKKNDNVQTKNMAQTKSKY